MAFFGEMYHIPKEDRNRLLYELKDLGLIKEIKPIENIVVINKDFKI